MLKRMVMAAVILCVSASVCLAKDEKGKQPPAKPGAPGQPAVISSQEQKDLLVANVNNMRNQELRVGILQQLLNEEIAKLRNLQAVFCDQYKLDVEKFRKGQYRFDEPTGKFVETEAPKGK